MIPFVDRGLPHLANPQPLGDLLSAFLQSVLAPDQARAGFREALSRRFGPVPVQTACNGRSALALALEACPSKKGDAVIIPAFVCPSVAQSTEAAGRVPVLCDIDPATLGMSPALLDATLTRRPDAGVVVIPHLLGLPADPELFSVCRRHGAAVVEDAAQSLGARLNNAETGTTGEFGIFSFGKGKNISCWSGGLAMGNGLPEAPRRPARRSVLRDLRRLALLLLYKAAVHPRVWPLTQMAFSHSSIGPIVDTTRELSAFSEALLARQLARYEETAALRNKWAARHKALARQHGFFSPEPYGSPCYLRFPVLLPQGPTAQEVRRSLLGQDITGVSSFEAYGIPWRRPDLAEGKAWPGAREVVDRILSLPIHHFVREADVDRIWKGLVAGTSGHRN